MEKRDVCQVRVVYFWAGGGGLFTLDRGGQPEEEQRVLLGFTDEQPSAGFPGRQA